MRVTFDCGHLGERGASVALYDYADWNESILGNQSIVVYDRTSRFNHPLAIERFNSRFRVVPYEGAGAYAHAVDALAPDVAYSQKAGRVDARLARSCRNAIHAVFRHFEPHGEAYAYISAWLSEHMTAGRYPSVPYGVKLPSPQRDARSDWRIPGNAIVFGRHGGYDQFDLPLVHKAVQRALEQRDDLYFVFLNTEPFVSSPRVRYLPAIVDLQQKADFIAACDYMLHGRRMGESFGAAVAEFLYFDKPVLCWAGGADRNHVRMVGGAGHIYRSGADLLELLLALGRAAQDGTRKARVEEFSPLRVMQRFKEVFLDAGAPLEGPLPSLKHWLRLRRSVLDRAIRVRDRYWLSRHLP